MDQFIIKANESWIDTKDKQRTRCLHYDTKAFYHSNYHGGGNWKINGTIENLICTLKNDRTPYSQQTMMNCVAKLVEILKNDLPIIKLQLGYNKLRVCVVPRAKRESHYNKNQLLFRGSVQFATNSLCGFEDGTHDIIRHTNTRTTHSNISGNGGNGPLPYCGITLETCNISSNIQGKNILLIDDLYTKTIGIDEDAIQALHDKGANNVFFYSVGKTVSRY